MQTGLIYIFILKANVFSFLEFSHLPAIPNYYLDLIPERMVFRGRPNEIFPFLPMDMTFLCSLNLILWGCLLPILFLVIFEGNFT